MATCPNKSLPQWKSLVERVGEDMSYYLWDHYKGTVPADAIDSFSSNEEGVKAPPSHSNRQIAAVRDWLGRLGVDVRSLNPGRYGGQSGITGLMENWTELSKGHKQEFVPEEAFHVGVALIKETNPSLYKEMFNAIGASETYKEMFDEYGSFPEYQQRGKPDIVKIKEEAIGRLLAAVYAATPEEQIETPARLQKAQSWLSRMMDWVGQLIIQAGFDPFASRAKPAVGIVIDTNNTLLARATGLPQPDFFQLSTPATDLKEGAIESLDAYLLDYLKPFGVTSQQIESFKERWDTDALGAVDAMNKIIYFSKNKKADTIPEEFAHMLTMLLGTENESLNTLLRDIDQWDGYQAIYDAYISKYGNELQVKMEAAGQFIAQSLVKGWKAKNKQESNWFFSILSEIKRMVQKLFPAKGSYYEDIADNITRSVLKGENIITAMDSLTQGEQLDYRKAMAANPFASSIMEKVASFGGKLTGSLAIAAQGEIIYRKSDEPIHDLDFVMPYGTRTADELDAFMGSMGGTPIHTGWANKKKKCITYAYFVPDKGYSVEVTRKTNDAFGYAEEIVLMKGESLVYRGAPNELPSEFKKHLLPVDFFFYNENAPLNSIGHITAWQDVFMGKLAMSPLGQGERIFQREKDLRDYRALQPRNTSLEKDELMFFQLSPNPTASTEGERLFRGVVTNNGVPIEKKDQKGTEDRHYLVNGRKVLKSVTDRTARYYERIKKNLSTSDYDKIKNEMVADYGVSGHADMQHIQNSLTDPDTGLLLPNPVKSTTYKPLTSPEIYDKLYTYLKARMNQFPAGTRFISEKPIYDPAQDEAGTPDFIAITPDGTGTILDWKFQDLISDGKFKPDVPWFKKIANNIQLGRYKQILTKVYGIKKWSNDTAAIPIAAHYKYAQTRKAQGDKNYYPVLVGITIGDADVSKITETALLPVVLTNASTGDAQLDQLVSQLREASEALEHQRKGTTDFKKKTQLNTQINLITKAVRHLQVQKSLAPLVDQAKEFMARTSPIIQEYHNTIKGKDYDTNKQMFNEFALRIQRAFTELDIYKDLPQNTAHLFTDPNDPVFVATKQLSYEALGLRGALLNMSKLFVDQLATSRNVQDINSAELTIFGGARLFTETSKIQTAAFSLFSQLRTEAKHRADFTTNEQNNKLVDLQKRYMEWARSRGYTKKNLYSLILNPTKENQLLDQYSVDFYKAGREAAKKKDKTWVEDNIDMEKYKAELIRLTVLEEELIDSRGDLDDTAKEKEKQIVYSKYSLDTRDSNGWALYHTFRLFPKQKHETQQWKELHAPGNAPALEFYNWIIDINKKAEAYGYLPEGLAARTFLPWVSKSLVERLVEGKGNPKALTDAFWHSITIDESSVGMGEFDEDTGKTKHKIPAYLLSPSLQGNSDQLFRNMGLYNQFVNEYGELSEIEGLALAIGRVEQNKRSIETSVLGKAVMRGGTIQEISSNEQNYSLYQDHLRALMYGEKFVRSDKFNVVLGNVNDTFAKINKKVGKKFFPENLTGRQISMNSLIEGTNTWFQLKALGINPVSAAVNRIGGFLQSITNAGTWFTKGDVVRGELEVLTKHLNGEEGKKFIAALRYFMPFTEDSNHDVLKKLAGTWTDSSNIQDLLMVMMRSGDRGVQAQIFNALWNNMIVMDGKIVNARDYYRRSAEYEARYAPGVSEQRRRAMEANFDEEVKKLIDKFGVKNKATVDTNGMLVIPGIERNSPTVHQARILSQELAKKTTGQMTDDETRGYQMNIYMKSMMIFKNWIPALADVRFGKFKYNNKTHAYEWGRFRTFARYLGSDFMKAGQAFLSGAKATEKGMEGLQKLYEEKKEDYERTTGKEFPITPAQFYDLTRINMRQMAKDVIVCASLVALWLAAKALPPDDDEDALVKNRYKWMLKVIDKTKDEMTFFYNPFSADAILNGTLFPSFGIVKDAMTLFGAFMEEMWGLSWGDDKYVEKNHVMKYLWKSFPVTSQISSWLPLIAPDAAKEYGIRMSSESRPRH